MLLLNNFYQRFVLNKNILYRALLIVFLILILFSDYHISFAIIFSLVVIDLTKNFIKLLNGKYGISLKLIGVLYVSIFVLIVFSILRLLIHSFITQNNKLIEITNNKNFINEKVEGLHNFFEQITERVLLMRKSVNSDLYNTKIDQLISNIPDIIISKSVTYLNFILEKSYISGLKFIDFWYTFLLTMVFLFYFNVHLNKMKGLASVAFGSFAKKIESFFVYVKNVILIVIINQLKVALILIVLYSIVLYFLDVEYFFVYSVFFGLLTLVPIVGSIFSIILLAISCYIFDYSFHYSMKLIGVLFSGFLLENLILTPKLVGKSINTHPLMVLCGVIILPQFFGVFGLIFTFPIVAILNDGICNIIGMIRNNEKRTNGQI